MKGVTGTPWPLYIISIPIAFFFILNDALSPSTYYICGLPLISVLGVSGEAEDLKPGIPIKKGRGSMKFLCV